MRSEIHATPAEAPVSTKETSMHRVRRIRPWLAALLAVGVIALTPSYASAAGFGIATFGGLSADEAGLSFTQAGGHPDQLISSFSYNLSGVQAINGPLPAGNAKDQLFELPAGLVGNAAKVETCSEVQLLGEATQHVECPPASQIGYITVNLPQLVG